MSVPISELVTDSHGQRQWGDQLQTTISIPISELVTDGRGEDYLGSSVHHTPHPTPPHPLPPSLSFTDMREGASLVNFGMSDQTTLQAPLSLSAPFLQTLP